MYGYFFMCSLILVSVDNSFDCEIFNTRYGSLVYKGVF